jgi:hypothetical protein
MNHDEKQSICVLGTTKQKRQDDYDAMIEQGLDLYQKRMNVREEQNLKETNLEASWLIKQPIHA